MEDFEKFERAQTRKALRAEQDQWDKANNRGKYSLKVNLDGLPQRTLDEPNASQRQKSYLKSLGISDAAFLSGLGKSQASAAISLALAQRERAGKSRGYAALMVISGLALLGLWLFLR
jgi:hypothetical protein